MKTLLLFLATTTTVFAQNCPEDHGKYGNGHSYQNIFCRIMVGGERNATGSNRKLTFSETGKIQVFSDVAGKGTGARVFYLFPKKSKNSIDRVDESGLSLMTASGVRFHFDKNGNMSSPDLKLRVSKEISTQNKGGIEIENYSGGIVVDIGYRAENAPDLNKNAVVTITDKNNKKCTMANSDIHRIKNYESELIYKTNESFHAFLSKKCPSLDISDLIKPMSQDLNLVKAPSKIGEAPSSHFPKIENDSKRDMKPRGDDLDSFIDNLDSKNIQK